MKPLTLFIASVLAAAAFTAAPAAASTPTECQAQIDALVVATNGAEFAGNNAAKNKAALVGKLEDAKVKLDQNKPADATLKLAQYRDRVVSLAEQGKLDSDDASLLQAGADGVLSCIADLGS